MVHRICGASCCLMLASVISQASAQEMPRHVRAALGKLVGEWKMEHAVGGKSTQSEIVVKWANDESVLVFTWKGTDSLSGKKTSSTGILGWDAAKRLVVEHEIDEDGSIFHGTHHISKDGAWFSPYQGSVVVDGKPQYFESHRTFKFVSEDEWTVTANPWTLNGEPQPIAVSTMQRKQLRLFRRK